MLGESAESGIRAEIPLIQRQTFIHLAVLEDEGSVLGTAFFLQRHGDCQPLTIEGKVTDLLIHAQSGSEKHLDCHMPSGRVHHLRC
eukprot:Skav208513  [mRNA]  locus=scaffold1322:48485:51086:- [translate_table: standard]